MDERTRIFQDMVERLTLSAMPTLGGWNGKISELEQHVSNGGEVQAGVFNVQSGRKADHRLDWALSMAGCLPRKPRSRALLIAHYCGPYMLEDHRSLCAYLHDIGVTDTGEGWQMAKSHTDSLGWTVSRFWAEVARKRILRGR